MADEPETTEHPAGLEARVDKLEDGQQSILGKLDQLLGRGEDKAEPVAEADPAPDAPDVVEQMRQAVRDVHAERDQAAAAKPDKPKPEVKPREAGQPGRERLARVLYGREPKRNG